MHGQGSLLYIVMYSRNSLYGNLGSGSMVYKIWCTVAGDYCFRYSALAQYLTSVLCPSRGSNVPTLHLTGGPRVGRMVYRFPGYRIPVLSLTGFLGTALWVLGGPSHLCTCGPVPAYRHTVYRPGALRHGYNSAT